MHQRKSANVMYMMRKSANVMGHLAWIVAMPNDKTVRIAIRKTVPQAIEK